MKKIIIPLMLILILVYGCGVTKPNHNSKINIRYEIKDIGINHVIIPSEFDTVRINGITVSKVYYSRLENRVLTHIITKLNIELDLKSCPIMDGYNMNKLECKYTLIK